MEINFKVSVVKDGDHQSAIATPTKLKLMETAGLLHRKDHTTVLHACREIKEQITKDEALNSSVSVLIKELQKRN